MKRCNRCNIEKELSEFYKRKRNKDGIDNKCKKCYNEINKENYIKNREVLLTKSKKRKSNNINPNSKRRTIIKLKEKCLYNQSVCTKCLTIRDNENFVKDLSRENELSAQCNICKNKYYNDRKKSDKLFKLSGRIRSIISKQINKNNLKKSKKTEDIIGCSFKEFKTHLESKFYDNMNWENYGEWHLDHIIPISYAKTEEEIYELNHYTNFQPLWAKDNLSKGNRFIG
jgi:hypothetical protein